MKPSHTMLTFWCDLHGIVLKRDTNGVRATAHDRQNRIITSVLEITGTVGLSKAEEAIAALKACDSIAEELCLLKPSVAHKLNLDHQ